MWGVELAILFVAVGVTLFVIATSPLWFRVGRWTARFLKRQVEDAVGKNEETKEERP